MVLNSELKIFLGFIIVIVCLSLFFLFIYNYIAPRIARLFEKFTDSYKYCIKFIYSDNKIKGYLGEIRHVNSLSVPNYGRVAKYKFELKGVINYAVLNLTLRWSNAGIWEIYSANLEIDRKTINILEDVN